MMFCDPSDWPESYREMRMIDSLLRCPICYEFFNCTMILPQCSHNYCSACIRRHLSYKQDCPTCQRSAEEAELANNRLLDKFVQFFIAAREKVLAAVHANPGAACPTSSQLSCSSSVLTVEESDTACIDSHLDKGARGPADEQKKASCPKCGKEVSQLRINVHLDQCLQQNKEKGAATSSSSASPGKRKPLAKLVYHLMKDAEIRAKLKEWGLSTDGDRQALIRRHHEFALLYNAECDTLAPRSAADLRKQVERLEMQRTRYKTSRTSQLQLPAVASTADGGCVDERQKAYRQAHKSQFASLLRNARSTQQAAKESLSSSQSHPVTTFDDDDDGVGRHRAFAVAAVVADDSSAESAAAAVAALTGGNDRGAAGQSSQRGGGDGGRGGRRCLRGGSIDAYFAPKARPKKDLQQLLPPPPKRGGGNASSAQPVGLTQCSSQATRLSQQPAQLTAVGLTRHSSSPTRIARHSSVEDTFSSDSGDDSLFLNIPEPPPHEARAFAAVSGRDEALLATSLATVAPSDWRPSADAVSCTFADEKEPPAYAPTAAAVVDAATSLPAFDRGVPPSGRAQRKRTFSASCTRVEDSAESESEEFAIETPDSASPASEHELTRCIDESSYDTCLELSPPAANE